MEKMIKNQNKRIAIFTYHYPVAFSPTILDTACYWAAAGYVVDLLVDRFVFSEIKPLHASINVVYCTNLPPVLNVGAEFSIGDGNKKKDILKQPEKSERKLNGFEQKKIVKRISRYIPMRFRIIYRNIILNIRKSLIRIWLIPLLKYIYGACKYVLFKKYTYFIAFHPEGLIAVSFINKFKKVPFYYHSLEIYEPDSLQARIRKYFEQRANQMAAFTIVQDVFRAEQLISKNKIKRDKIKLCPVSASGPAQKSKSSYFYKLFNINPNKKIILHLGGIGPESYSLEIAQQTNSKNWHKDWVLIFHGFCGGSIDYLENILSKTKRDRVFISLEIVESKILDKMTASADIGIALYKPKDKNYKYTILSSNKIAQYYKYGLPIILNDFEVTRHFIDEHKCGYCIKDLTDLTYGLEKIFQNYSFYREKSFEVFEEKYSFQKNYSPIFKLLNEPLDWELNHEKEYLHER